MAIANNKAAPGRRTPGRRSLQRNRRGFSGWDKRQHFWTFVRDGDGVLDVGAGLAVDCHDRPAVRQNLGKMRSLVDHRLDRENEATLDLWSKTWPAIVRNLRVFVHP